MSHPVRVAPPSAPPLDPRTHRALGGASRVRLLQELHADGPLEADELAERVGLHLNTVRAHLGVLREAGLVSAHERPPIGPGRPRLAFAATDIAHDDGHPRAYWLLAQILTASLGTRKDGPKSATAAGRLFGRQLAERRDSPARKAADPRSGVLELLDRFGFAPRPEGQTAPGGSEVIGLHQCPLRDLAEASSEIVCSAHLGLLQGAVDQLGGNSDAVRLIPFAAPGLCRVVLDKQ